MPRKSFRSFPLKNKICNKTRKCIKLCMDVEGGNCCENTRILSFPCHGGPNQNFYHNSKTQQIISKSSGKCIDIGPKQSIIQRKCSAKKTQKWIRTRNRNWKSVANKKHIRMNPMIGPLTFVH